MVARSSKVAEGVTLGEVLTDPRTFAGRGRIVDTTIVNWLSDSTEMSPKVLGRIVRTHVLKLSAEEAGMRLQAAFEVLDEEVIGYFFRHCAKSRLERR